MKKGITVAGSILVDHIHEISAYPHAGELTQIRATGQASGGCVPNVAVDLRMMEPSLRVDAIGKVGHDGDGTYVLERLAAYGIRTAGVVRNQDRTSFTEVMSIMGGQRTFFTYPGASSDFGYADIDFDKLDTDMLHLGYLLLLDKVDNGDGVRILAEAQRRGILTSVDFVSENSDRYLSVLPALAHTDNLIINEMEAGRLAEMEPTFDNLRAIAEKIKSYGVSDRVIIHMPEVGVCLSARGFTVVPSYELPEGYIKGTTGAGDAFCAGALLGIYEGLTDEEILVLASGAAAAALSSEDAVSGMRSRAEIGELCRGWKRKAFTA